MLSRRLTTRHRTADLSTIRRAQDLPTPLPPNAIEDQANAFLADGLRDVKRVSVEKALRAPTTQRHDYIEAYVGDLGNVIDMEVDPGRQNCLGIDPLGGAASTTGDRLPSGSV